MKALYFGLGFSDAAVTGSEVIRKRNLEFVRNCFGEENVVCYRHVLPKVIRPLRWFSLLFRDLAGEGLFTDRGLLRAVRENNVETIFIDGTVGTRFKRAFLRRHRAISFFHNVEYDYYRKEMENFLRNDRSARRRIHQVQFALTSRLVYINERNLCRYSDTVITLNERDSKRLKELYGRKADLILPTSMRDRPGIPAAREECREEPYLLFVGSDFYGNTDGLFPFCEQCMPKIGAKLVVAGTGMEKYADRFDPGKIKFPGYVPDLGELYGNAAAVVLPIISGSGMKTKTCEALMYGKVIFGTRESFEGYAAQESEDCILCEDWDEFVSKISTYLREGPEKYSGANRGLFLKYYENSAVEKLFAAYVSGNKRTTGRDRDDT